MADFKTNLSRREGILLLTIAVLSALACATSFYVGYQSNAVVLSAQQDVDGHPHRCRQVRGKTGSIENLIDYNAWNFPVPLQAFGKECPIHPTAAPISRCPCCTGVIVPRMGTASTSLFFAEHSKEKDAARC